MATYKNELDSTLVAKHLSRLELEKITEKFKSLEKRSDALAVLADNPYSYKNVVNAEADLEMQIDTYLQKEWSYDGRWKLYEGINRLREKIEVLMPITSEDLIPYVGILIDLLEFSSMTEKDISAFRFHLRVSYNDDYRAMVEDMASDLNMVRKEG